MTNAEKQKRYRDRQKALRSGAVGVESVTPTVTVLVDNMTITDKLFDLDNPGYYIFEKKKPWWRKCWMCGKEYETRLELNKFCTPTCKDQYLASAVSEGALWRARA